MDVTQPVARTAFYCSVIRADDAASAQPVCGDTLASRFVDERIRRDLAPATSLRYPAASNIARHRIIDDLVRARLAAAPDTRVILLGAGFDTRAYRMTGGRWFELDDPPLLAYKEERLPAAESPNPLTRIPIAFQDERPDDYLGRLAGDDAALVILEGVSMYLGDDTLRDLSRAIRRAFPRAAFVCDLMTPRFANRYGKPLRQAFRSLGATFGEGSLHPRDIVRSAGYRIVRAESMMERARQLGSVRMPRWLLSTLMREARDGYQLYEWAPV